MQTIILIRHIHDFDDFTTFERRNSAFIDTFCFEWERQIILQMTMPGTGIRYSDIAPRLKNTGALGGFLFSTFFYILAKLQLCGDLYDWANSTDYTTYVALASFLGYGAGAVTAALIAAGPIGQVILGAATIAIGYHTLTHNNQQGACKLLQFAAGAATTVGGFGLIGGALPLPPIPNITLPNPFNSGMLNWTTPSGASGTTGGTIVIALPGINVGTVAGTTAVGATGSIATTFSSPTGPSDGDGVPPESPLTPDQVDRIVNEFNQQFGKNPDAVYVVGSYADDAATVSSDIDIWIQTDIPNLNKWEGAGFEYFKSINPGKVPDGIIGIGPGPNQAFIGPGPGQIPKAGLIDPIAFNPNLPRPPFVQVWP